MSRMSNILATLLGLMTMAACGEEMIYGSRKPSPSLPKGHIPSDKQKCQPKQQHEFTIKGVKIMAASKKDAIKKYKHHKADMEV